MSTPQEKKKIYNENYRKRIKEKQDAEHKRLAELELKEKQNQVTTAAEVPALPIEHTAEETKVHLELIKAPLEVPLEPPEPESEPESEYSITMEELDEMIEKKAQQKAELFFLKKQKEQEPEQKTKTEPTQKSSFVMNTLKGIGESLVLMSIPVIFRFGTNYFVNSRQSQQIQPNISYQQQSTQSVKKSDSTAAAPFYNTGVFF